MLYIDHALHKLKEVLFVWKRERQIDRKTSIKWQRRHTVITRHDILHGRES